MLLSKAGSSGAAVKLLDFGLASRARAPRPQGPDTSLAATMAPSMAATQSPATASGTIGAISGTVPYMAPEPLDGAAGDMRSDIFAFGYVLYEMLAGRKAFDGASPIRRVAARGVQSKTLPLSPPPARVIGVRRSCPTAGISCSTHRWAVPRRTASTSGRWTGPHRRCAFRPTRTRGSSRRPTGC